MHLGRVTGGSFFLLSVLGCTEATPKADWCSHPDPAVVVHFSPSGDDTQLTLTEVWRIGEPGDSTVFGRPGQAAVSQGGRVAIPDMPASAVIVVDSDGTWRGEVTKKGEGPGEVRWPAAAEWLSEDRIAVFDFSVGKVVEVPLESEGEPTEWRINPDYFTQIGMAGQLPGLDLVGDGSVLLELPWTPIPGGSDMRRAVVVWQRRNGAADTLQLQDVRVLTDSPYQGWSIPGHLRPIMTAGTESRVALGGDQGGYRLRLLNRRGDDSAIACRGIEPIPLTRHELGLVEPDRAPGVLTDLLKEAARPEQVLPFGRMFFGEGGRIWVQRERLDPLTAYSPVEGGSYDIFGKDGDYTGTVIAPGQVVLFGEGGGRVFGFERGEFDDLRLVAFVLDQGTQ